MHIILDSNIYLSDIRMAGTSFQGLFDLIRRTDSTLVLPHLVREEVVARYQERMVAAAQALKKASNEFQGLLITKESVYLDNFTIEKRKLSAQRNALRRRLRKPATGINILNMTSTEGVDLKDVYLRGINRLAPASKKGEELRDVIIWLSVISHAKASGERVAFVTSDNGFFEGVEVHPELLREIAADGLDVQVLKRIGDLIKVESPTKVEIAPSEVIGLIGEQVLESALHAGALEVLKEHFGGHRAPSYTASNTRIKNIRVLDAAAYPVNHNLSFAELDYGFELLYSQESQYRIPEPAEETFQEAFKRLLSAPQEPEAELKVVVSTWSFDVEARVFARIMTGSVETFEAQVLRVKSPYGRSYEAESR